MLGVFDYFAEIGCSTSGNVGVGGDAGDRQELEVDNLFHEELSGSKFPALAIYDGGLMFPGLGGSKKSLPVWHRLHLSRSFAHKLMVMCMQLRDL